MAAGFLIAAISVDVIRVDESTIHAPRWVLFLISVALGSAGVLAMARQNSRASDLLGAIVLFSMAAVGTWVSLFSPSQGFSGGFVFLPQEVNVGMARGVFGVGAMLSLAMCAYAVWRAIRRHI